MPDLFKVVRRDAADVAPLTQARPWTPQTSGVSGSPSLYYSQNMTPATYTSANTVLPAVS